MSTFFFALAAAAVGAGAAAIGYDGIGRWMLFRQRNLWRKKLDAHVPAVKEKRGFFPLRLPDDPLKKRAVVFGLLGALTSGMVFGFFGFLLGAAAGGAWPYLRVAEEKRRFKEKIRRELPEWMEALSLSAQAGLSFEQALEYDEASAGESLLRGEIRLFLGKVRAGAPRSEALQEIADRLDLPEFHLFTTTLIQAEKTGTGFAAMFSELAENFRDQEVQRLERKIQELPVKMLFPLLLFFFPVTFLLIFTPVLIQLGGF